jgi:hypothetical protein
MATTSTQESGNFSAVYGFDEIVENKKVTTREIN